MRELIIGEVPVIKVGDKVKLLTILGGFGGLSVIPAGSIGKVIREDKFQSGIGTFDIEFEGADRVVTIISNSNAIVLTK